MADILITVMFTTNLYVLMLFDWECTKYGNNYVGLNLVLYTQYIEYGK